MKILAFSSQFVFTHSNFALTALATLPLCLCGYILSLKSLFIHSPGYIQSSFCTPYCYFVIMIVRSSISFNMLMPPDYSPSRVTNPGYKHYTYQVIYFFLSQPLISWRCILSLPDYYSLTSTCHNYNQDTSWLYFQPIAFIGWGYGLFQHWIFMDVANFNTYLDLLVGSKSWHTWALWAKFLVTS